MLSPKRGLSLPVLMTGALVIATNVAASSNNIVNRFIMLQIYKSFAIATKSRTAIVKKVNEKSQKHNHHKAHSFNVK